MADAAASKAVEGNLMWVQVPLPVFILFISAYKGEKMLMFPLILVTIIILYTICILFRRKIPIWIMVLLVILIPIIVFVVFALLWNILMACFYVHPK